MPTIENTSTRDPLVHAAGMLSGSDDYITGMESQGQRQLVQSDYLPTEGDWEAVEALGFKRGEVVASDPLFTEATLPAGWRKEGTGHSMWSNVVDERGVTRVGVGYKAAFYDRWARFHVVSVGGAVATDMIYGDEVVLPERWGVLTDAEKQDARKSIQAVIDQNTEHVTRYDDPDGYWQKKVDRAKLALALTE